MRCYPQKNLNIEELFELSFKNINNTRDTKNLIFSAAEFYF